MKKADDKNLKLFLPDPGEVLGIAYGLGVDSTALLVGLKARGVRPDFILFADTGCEKAATYAYLPVISAWLEEVGFPPVTVVRYAPKNAPYTTLEGNMVMNATLPGAAFGWGSCTMKWKIAPQNKWSEHSGLCKAAWTNGRKVSKMIGFEAGEEYRRNKAHTSNDTRFDYLYPLISWGWDREECKARIREAGLPVPPKSACVFCPNMKPEEILDLTEEERGRIARVELAAEPYNKKVHGLWRRPRKADGRPGSITAYMVENEIPFTDPRKLAGEMPLNPNCGKFTNGYTFRPPHDAPNVRAMLENKFHWELITEAA